MGMTTNAHSIVSVHMPKSSFWLVDKSGAGGVCWRCCGKERVRGYEAPNCKEDPYLASVAVTFQPHLNFNFTGGC